MPDPRPPAVPESTLEGNGWVLVDERVETLVEKSWIQVRGATRRYEDDRSRRALREATPTGIDHPIRFFAVTNLAIESSFPTGFPATLFRTKIRRKMRESFVDRLEREGLVDIEREDRDRIRLPNRTRLRLDRYSAVDRIEDATEEGSPGMIDLPVECAVGLWIDGGTLRVLAGGYPAATLATTFDVEASEGPLTTSPAEYRHQFEALLRDVVRAITAESSGSGRT